MEVPAVPEAVGQVMVAVTGTEGAYQWADDEPRPLLRELRVATSAAMSVARPARLSTFLPLSVSSCLPRHAAS